MNNDKDFEDLILSGAISPAAIDPETGEMLYSFNPELEKINPQLHSLVMNNFLFHAMKLWELGFINMDVTDKNPMVSLTSSAFDDEKLKDLDEDMRFSLSEMKRVLLQ